MWGDREGLRATRYPLQKKQANTTCEAGGPSEDASVQSTSKATSGSQARGQRQGKGVVAANHLKRGGGQSGRKTSVPGEGLPFDPYAYAASIAMTSKRMHRGDSAGGTTNASAHGGLPEAEDDVVPERESTARPSSLPRHRLAPAPAHTEGPSPRLSSPSSSVSRESSPDASPANASWHNSGKSPGSRALARLAFGPDSADGDSGDDEAVNHKERGGAAAQEDYMGRSRGGNGAADSSPSVERVELEEDGVGRCMVENTVVSSRRLFCEGASQRVDDDDESCDPPLAPGPLPVFVAASVKELHEFVAVSNFFSSF